MVNDTSISTRYEPVPNWAKIPHGVWLREATSVAVDSQDRVYVFNRGNVPILVFDIDGNVVDMWGNDDPQGGVRITEDPYGNKLQFWNGWFMRPHGVFCDHEDNVWLVDDVGNQIHKYTRYGERLMTIGSGEAVPRQSGEMFNRPTDVTVSPANGDVFISDGYGNSRVHRLDADGKHILSWGESGTDDGKFNLPHNIAMLDDELVIVCDRESHRVQVFTTDGEFVRQWPVHKATAVNVQGKGADARVYVGEQGPAPVQRGVANIGNRVSIYDWQGNMLDRFGNPHFGQQPDQFLWPHGIAVDSDGSVYVAEVSFVEWGRNQLPPVDNPASLRKWQLKH